MRTGVARPTLAALLMCVGLAGCGRDAGSTSADEARAAPPRQAGPPAGASDPWTHLRAIAALGARNGGTRAAGTPGGRATEELVARRLRARGYSVRYEAVRFPFFSERRPPRVEFSGRRLRAGDDLRTLGFSPGGTVRAPLARVGGARADAGCRAADWRGFERGRIALVRRGVCPFSAKAQRAQAAGAAAVLIVDREATGPGGPVRGTLGRPGLRVPAVAVDADAGAALAGARGAVRLTVDAVSATRTGRNVIAELAGSEGTRVTMAGAHLDSVADGPGVNDNGSGISALLAIAARLSRGERPRDTIRLAFWTAEELGLYGSRRHVALLDERERRRLRAYVNLDMVASPNAVLETYGSGAAERALRRALDARGPLPGRASIAGASDHAPFVRAGVEVGGVFTGASERVSARDARRFGARAGRPADPCYHRACDTLGNADRGTLKTATGAVDAALRSLAG
jgi:hypothetical protein